MRTATSKGYNPNKKISQVEIGQIQEAAKKREGLDYREYFRLLSPTEINDLRASMRRVQGSGDSAASVRALRMIELLDWFEDEVEHRQRLEKVIDGASEVTYALTELADETGDVLGKDHAGNIADIFQDHAPENAATHVAAYVKKELEAARNKVAEQVKSAQKAVAAHVEALEALSHVDET